MSDLKAAYKETLTQVLALEAQKKSLSQKMLHQRSLTERRSTIIDFISQDLKKHNLLGQILVECTNQQENEILASIAHLYGTDNSEDLPQKVESNQRLNQRMLDLLDKGMKTPGECDFLERRLLMEIEKQALRQAHDYLHPLQSN